MPIYPPSLLGNLLNPWIPVPTTVATRPTFVVVADIGQGNLNAIFNDNGQPFLYYDLGGGSGPNTFTQADTRSLICPAIVPKVILSNWDSDHITNAGVLTFNGGLANGLPNTEWLVREYPSGQYTLTAEGLQVDIDTGLHGRVTHWVAGVGSQNWQRGWMTLFKSTGTNLNDTGVAVRIENPDPNFPGEYMLIWGDAQPGNTHGADLNCVGMVAIHHGADVVIPNDLPQPLPVAGPRTSRTLVFSYGLANSYGHPATGGVNAYDGRLWDEAYRLDTAGGEAIADSGAGARGNCAIVWPGYVKGPGSVAADAGTYEVQAAAASLIASAVAEIELQHRAALANGESVAVAAAFEAARLVQYRGSARVVEAMRGDGHLGYMWRQTAGGNWDQRDGGLTMEPAVALTGDPNVAGTLYAGTANHLYGSVDDGGNWAPLLAADVRGIAVDPANSHVYAATAAGVQVSTNSGAAWVLSNNGLGNTNVWCVAVDYANAGHVYAGTGAGIYKTVNQGAQWTLAGVLAFDVRCLLVSPGNAAEVFAGTAGAGVYFSSDSGASWNAWSNGLGDPNVRALASHGGVTPAVYAGTAAGVFRIVAGHPWNAVNTGLLHSDVRALIADSANPGTLRAGTDGGVYLTANGGTGWATDNAGLHGVSVGALAQIGGDVFAAFDALTLAAVAQTVNGGVLAAGALANSMTNVAALAATAADAYVAGQAEYASTAVFEAAAQLAREVTALAYDVHERMGASPIGSQSQEANLDAYDFLVSPGALRIGSEAIAPGTVNNLQAEADAIAHLGAPTVAETANSVAVAAAASHEFRMGHASSTHRGYASLRSLLPPAAAADIATLLANAPHLRRADFSAALAAVAALAPTAPVHPEATGPGLVQMTALAVESATPAIFASHTTVEEHQFEDLPTVLWSGGGSFDERWNGLPAQVRVNALAIDPGVPQTIYAGLHDNGVYKTADSGANWAASGIGNRDVWCIAIDNANGQIVYAGTAAGVYRSANGAGTWHARNNNLGNLSVRCIAIEPAGGATLYAGTAGGVYKTTNSGTLWAAANNLLGNQDIRFMVIDANNVQTIYAATAGGVYTSANGGVSWAAVNNGLGSLNVVTLAIDPGNPQIIYAGTPDMGVFKTVNSGGLWNPAITGLASLDVRVLALDPGLATTVYAATRRGLFTSTDSGGRWAASTVVNASAARTARVAGVAAQVGVAAGIATADAAKAAVAAARVIVPAAFGAPQIACHRLPRGCGANTCGLAIHYFNWEA